MRNIIGFYTINLAGVIQLKAANARSSFGKCADLVIVKGIRG